MTVASKALGRPLPALKDVVDFDYRGPLEITELFLQRDIRGEKTATICLTPDPLYWGVVTCR